MKLFRILALLLICSCTFLTGCIDKSKLTTQNLKRAINFDLAHHQIYIAIVGQSVNEGTMQKPYVIFEPEYSSSAVHKNTEYENQYLQGILDYAFTLEKSNVLTLTRSDLKRKMKFVGMVDTKGFVLSYANDIERTLKPTKYPGIFKAMIGNLEVRDFVKTNYPYIEDGVKTIDVKVNVKLANLLDCISEDVIIASYAYEEISKTVISYKLYLDETERQWKVKSSKAYNIDCVKRFYKSITSNNF